MITHSFWILLGGGIGSVCRFWLGKYLQQTTKVTHFPIGTLCVNLIGCFLIGVLFSYFQKTSMQTSNGYFFGITGFCGGFTTFSTFSLENIQLLKEGNIGYMILYIALSVVVGILGTWAGLQIK